MTSMCRYESIFQRRGFPVRRRKCDHTRLLSGLPNPKDRKPLWTAAVLIATLAGSTSAWSQQKTKPQQTGIEGTWIGSVQQLGKPKPYALNLTVTKSGGTTEYPDLKCEGKLTRVGSSGVYTFFIETITKGSVSQGGSCINGSITMLSIGDKLAWGWFGADQGAVATAHSTLARK